VCAYIDLQPDRYYIGESERTLKLRQGNRGDGASACSGGGVIVLLREGTPLIAVVALCAAQRWVPPKGKLEDGNYPRCRRTRLSFEETGITSRA